MSQAAGHRQGDTQPESSRAQPPALPRALGLAQSSLAKAPSGLLTDFDGTLSPIVADPSLARLVEGASAALARLARRLAVVAVVTGRAADDARRMTHVPGLLIAGNHGVEWLEPDAARPRLPPQAAAVAERLEAALAGLPGGDGLFVERKGASATVHYRGTPDPPAARRAILDHVARRASELDVREGRMSVELRPRGLGDKGAAARAIVERFGLRGVVVMGDDLTDLDMFAAVRALRDEGRIAATVVGVGGADREVPAAVIDASDVVLADPAEAAALLAALAEGAG